MLLTEEILDLCDKALLEDLATLLPEICVVCVVRVVELCYALILAVPRCCLVYKLRLECDDSLAVLRLGLAKRVLFAPLLSIFESI